MSDGELAAVVMKSSLDPLDQARIIGALNRRNEKLTVSILEGISEKGAELELVLNTLKARLK